MEAVRDNPALSRFELEAEGVTSFIDYVREGATLALTHERVPDEVSGRGLGTALVKGTLELMRSRGEKVVPICPFVAAYMLKHKDTQDLLADPHYFDRHGH